jgi:hypothetical protein
MMMVLLEAVAMLRYAWCKRKEKGLGNYDTRTEETRREEEEPAVNP